MKGEIAALAEDEILPIATFTLQSYAIRPTKDSLV
jgi:hypothetical protein